MMGPHLPLMLTIMECSDRGCRNDGISLTIDAYYNGMFR